MTWKIVMLFLFVGSALIMSFARASRGKKIIFLGDSITFQGINAMGYIKLLDSIIKSENADMNYNLISSGVSGNKVYDLYLRLEEDVISKSPELTVIFIGINDVRHKKISGTGTDEDSFEKFYRAIINKLKYAGSKIIICTPAVSGERKDNANLQDEDLNNYCNIIRNLAEEYNLPLVDLRQLFQNYLMDNNPENSEFGILTVDGVHLSKQGNSLVANALWQEIKMMKL